MKTKGLLGAVLSVSMLAATLGGSLAAAEEPGAAQMTVDAASDAESSKDTLVIRINSDPASFDRHINASYYAMMVQSCVCSYLLNREYDENGNYVTVLNDYSLATDYQFDDNNQGVSFTLRDGVLFSNGTELTADDVVFSIGLFSDQAAYDFVDFENVTALDEQTVYVPFTATDANALNRIADIPIYSQAYYEECDAATDNAYFYGEGIMSTGPYKMVEYAAGDHITMEANENYFAGAPKIKNVIVRIIKEASVALMELQTGGVDILNDPDWIEVNDTLNGVYGEDFGVIKNGSNSVQYLGFNCSADSACGDLLVRQAICYAINLDDVLAGAYEGICEEVKGVVSDFAEGTSPYADGDWPYEYNPDKAKELLAEAGYADGLDLTLIFSGNENRKMAAEIVANQLKDVGINVTINQGEGATIVAVMANETDNWDLWIRAFENDPSPSKFFQDYSVTNTHPEEQDSYEQYTEYVADFASDMADESRVATWEEFQSFYMENCLYTYPLAQSVDYTLYNTHLKNFNKLLYNNWDITHAYFE